MKYLFAVLVLMLLSCQRSIDLQINSSDQYVENTSTYQKYYQQELNNALDYSDLKSVLNDQLKPNWSKATLQKTGNSSVLIVPLPFNENNFINNDILQDRFLSLEIDQNNRYSYWSIVIIDSKKQLTNQEKAESINKETRKHIASFTGRINIFDLKYSFIEYAEYESGIEKKSGLVATPSSNNGNASDVKTQSTSSCTDWFLVTRVNGVVISEVYITTTCDCEQNSIPSSSRARIGCGGGGSGGGTTSEFGPGKGIVAQYNDPCSFFSNLWSRSNDNRREWFGVVTTDGHYIVTQMLGPNGGNIDGIAHDLAHNRECVYYYKITPNSSLPNIAGARIVTDEGVDYYAVPITATIHTHPIAGDPEGLLTSPMSSVDIDLSTDFKDIRHWTMNDQYVVQFDKNGRFNLGPCNLIR